MRTDRVRPLSDLVGTSSQSERSSPRHKRLQWVRSWRRSTRSPLGNCSLPKTSKNNTKAGVSVKTSTISDKVNLSTYGDKFSIDGRLEWIWVVFVDTGWHDRVILLLKLWCRWVLDVIWDNTRALLFNLRCCGRHCATLLRFVLINLTNKIILSKVNHTGFWGFGVLGFYYPTFIIHQNVRTDLTYTWVQ